MASNKKLYINIFIAILINLIPVWGVIFHNWSVYNILFVFWLQTLIVGVINIFKIIIYYKRYLINLLFALFLFVLPFFIFLPVAYIFVYIFLKPELIGNFVLPTEGEIFSDFIFMFVKNIYIFYTLCISELYLFFTVFIGEKEYREGHELSSSISTSDRIYDPTFEPFGRLFALIILSVVGFFPTLITHSSLPSLLLLVIGKIIYDIEVEKYHFEKNNR